MTRTADLRTRVGRTGPALAASAAIAVLTVVGAIQSQRGPFVVAALGALVVLTGTVLVRTGARGWPLVVGLAVLTTAVGAACWGDPRNFGWFGMCVVVGWAALVLPTRWAVGLTAVVAATFLAMLAWVSQEPGWVTWTLGVALTCGAFVFVRRQRDLVDRLHAAQARLAEHARTDERHRIARELHDLVGHSLTVALLHLGSARLALDDDLDGARASLDEAERAARESLNDVRAAVGLLRTGEAADPLPVPTAAGIPGLVESYRNAGVPVDLALHGDLSRLTPNRGLALYRIVQESLTNAARHGDGTPISVRLDIADGRALLTVRNSGAFRARGPAGTGLAAMRERAAAAGGTLTAGPDRGAWLVEAVIPA